MVLAKRFQLKKTRKRKTVSQKPKKAYSKNRMFHENKLPVFYDNIQYSNDVRREKPEVAVALFDKRRADIEGDSDISVYVRRINLKRYPVRPFVIPECALCSR